MNNLKIHTVDSAPEGSKPLLEQSVKDFGFIPNLHGVLAASPNILEAYKNLHQSFSNSSFDKDELTVVWQTINVEHECHYCVPAHTAIAHMMKVDPAITDAMRNRTELPSEKLQALHNMTLSVVRNRGNVDEKEVATFYAAGYEPKHLMDIVLGLSQKVISNYTNHLAKTAVDAPFTEFAWESSHAPTS